jgi:hypothetical protein
VEDHENPENLPPLLRKNNSPLRTPAQRKSQSLPLSNPTPINPLPTPSTNQEEPNQEMSTGRSPMSSENSHQSSRVVRMIAKIENLEELSASSASLKSTTTSNRATHSLPKLRRKPSKSK